LRRKPARKPVRRKSSVKRRVVKKSSAVRRCPTCKAFVKTGHRCRQSARMNGYCTIHYIQKNYKKKKKSR